LYQGFFFAKRGVFLAINVPMVSLQDIALKYDQNLAGKTLTFNVKHKDTPFILKFDKGHLPHLLALHKFGYKRSEAIYPDLLNGNITWDLLSSRNTGSFEENELRMRYFYYVTDLLQSPKIAIFVKNSGSTMDADFMFYSEKGQRYISLGIRKEKSPSNFYVPVTFIDSKKNKWSKNKHVLIT
jgi:hypothetical protein